jgi:solute carrier family 35 protein F5
MGITLSSDFIYVIAMLKTTPLVVTIGLSLTIPLAVLGDFFLGKPATGQVLFGAALVLISFLAVGIQSLEPKADDDLLNNVLQLPRDEEGNLGPADER